MQVGDMVRLSTDEPCIQQVWIISAMKADINGVWLQFEETEHDGNWYCAELYEAISENR